MQDTLESIGYPIELTGIFDEQTVQYIKRFQTSFGLVSDGIVGPRTKALLYMVSQ
jgi:peptidoglycan hydrolase-like protein with peptidoglycan-binding domain